MAKTVEVTFAIGASLGGSFNSTFGKAGQSFEALQKQLTSLQQQSGQISDFQKLQDTVNKNQASMELMRQNSQALDTQMAASTERTAGLKSQYGNAQAEVERLNAVLVRNKDAYQAAQLNAESLKNQIQNSNGSTAELQKRYEAAQVEVRRLGDAVKQNSTDFRSAQQNAKRLKTEMKASAKETKDMQKQSRDLTAQANKLQTGLNNDRKALAHMKMELSFAGIATKQLTEHQAQLEAQTKRVTDAQNRLKAAQANFEAARQQLSWNNIKGDIMTSAGLAYSLYKPMKQAADFESAMARVNAVAFTGLGKSDSQKALDAKEFQKLQEQARELGRATQYTAVQVANTQEVLVRAGFKSNEVISAMPGLLSMPAAEGMDLSSAADIAASTLRGFQLSADQSGRVADVLAQTSAASNTSIAGLGESMKMVAPVAASLGVSIEQTSAMLGVMANNGIKGTESGTALRNAFLRLSQEPKAVAESLSQLGIASRTADGNMRSLPSIMLALSKRMKDMGEADKLKHLSNIFGVRAASGMLAVMQGAVDGSLDELERLNKEATGILVALSDNVAKATGGKFTVNTEEMRVGMKDIEPVAEKLGISFRDLSIYTALLAKNGIKGANANLMMSQAFSQLSKNSNSVQKALKRFNITAYTKNGELKDFPELLREIGTAISGLDEKTQKKTLSQIFGGEDAAIAAQTWIKSLNDGSWFDMDKAAEGAKGVSYQMMAKQLATFSGQWEIAKSAMQDFMIEVGNVLLPYATKIVEAFGKITAATVEIMRKFPVMTKVVVTGLGTIAALKIVGTIGRIGGSIGRLAKSFLELSSASAEATKLLGGNASVIGTAFSSLASPLSSLKGVFGAVWGAAAAHPFVAIGLAALAAVELIYHNWDSIKSFGISMWNKIKEAAEDFGKWWDSWTLGDIFEPLYDFAVAAIKKLYEPFERFANWLGGLFKNPFASWTAPSPETLKAQETAIKNSAQGHHAASVTAGWAKQYGGGKNKAPDNNAKGGIITRPTLSWVGEAGREAIIPLENPARGTQLWLEAGRELGVINNSQAGDVISDIVNALKIQNWSEAQNYSSENISGNGAINVNVTDLQKITPVTPHAMGGIFSQPHIGLVAEAGREAIIPLENPARGTQLWLEAGRELGVINNSQAGNVISDVVNALKIQNWSEAQNYSSENISGNGAINVNVPDLQKITPVTPHAMGGIFSQPHIGLVAEAGREAIIPLENPTRGTQLWLNAGQELGLLRTDFTPTEHNDINILNRLGSQGAVRIPSEINIFNSQSELLEDQSRKSSLWETAENDNYYSQGTSTENRNISSPSIIFSPNITVTVTGGSPEAEQEYKQITEELFEEMFAKFQEKMQRVKFED